MAECDINFQRLMKLFPSVRHDDFKCVMLLPGDAGTRVELSVLKRGPYTTLLQLTQVPKQDWGTSPNMKIQLYHDTKSAEVVAYQHQSRFHGAYEYPNRRMRRMKKNSSTDFWVSILPCLAVGMSTDTLELPNARSSSSDGMTGEEACSNRCSKSCYTLPIVIWCRRVSSFCIQILSGPQCSSRPGDR